MSDLIERLPLVFVERYGKFHDLARCGGGDRVLVAVSRQAAARKGTVAVNREAYLKALSTGVKYIYLHSTATGHRLFMSIMELPSSANIWRDGEYQVVTLPEWHRHEGFSPCIELDQELLKSEPAELPKHPMHPLAAAHQPVAREVARRRVNDDDFLTRLCNMDFKPATRQVLGDMMEKGSKEINVGTVVAKLAANPNGLRFIVIGHDGVAEFSF